MLAQLRRLFGFRRPNPGPGLPVPPDDLRARWEREGYIVLDGLFSPAECDAVLEELESYTGP